MTMQRINFLLITENIFIDFGLEWFKWLNTYHFYKAHLTQNTRLIRLATRVNRTYNRTYREFNRVKLGPFECISASRVWFLKLKKNCYGWNVREWSYKWPYKTVGDRVRPYETVYTTLFEDQSTSEPNRAKIVYKSYGIVRDRPQVLHPTSD
jgi:hypothetical protein